MVPMIRTIKQLVNLEELALGLAEGSGRASQLTGDTIAEIGGALRCLKALTYLKLDLQSWGTIPESSVMVLG
jgi:hypothetical protein